MEHDAPAHPDRAGAGGVPSEHAATLHQRPGGYFKALAYVISTTAVIAIRSGSENITMKEIDAATAQLGP
ncbi:hypothetical protein ACGF3J_36815 [Streptomyces sp. NPDC048171]|uniref:hypothetical protein n=1 Tax=Streptomyces sp. NPDC048171 TaxID=3365504 RepID=UPI0037172BA5